MRSHLTFSVASFIVFFLLLGFAVSCQAVPEEKPDFFTVASWNVQNLFDCVDDGFEYDEYRSSSGWNSQTYQKRLEKVAEVLCRDKLKEADVVVLNEVENSNVVDDLLSCKALSDRGFRYYICCGADGGAIQVAVISRFEIASARIHSVSEEDGLRPVLEVEFQTDHGSVFLLALHAKSNVGGVQQTNEMRIRLGQTVADVASAIERQNPGALILVAGDFNDECWSDSLMGRYDWSSSPLPVSGSPTYGRWYCFWMDEELRLWPSGSYYYDNSWLCYDNILASASAKDNTGWELLDAGVMSAGDLLDAAGKPNAWNRQLLKGVSDHLPVYMRFMAM